jgi:hypothetical protein
MDANEFNNYWKSNYSATFPLGYEVVAENPEKRFRIHSLPLSKRYADTEAEYQIILDRQNELFDAVIGEGTDIILLFCTFTNDLSNKNYVGIRDYSDFKLTETLDLNKKCPEEEYPKGFSMRIFIKSEKWKKGNRDKILKQIADDEIKVLFICPSKKRIIAPYDGGIDVIMENETKRNEFKLRYKKWLSYREDGL